MKRGGDRGGLRFGKCLRNEGDAERKAVGTESARDGDGAKAHQIDEISISAEASVEHDRLSFDFFYSVDCRRGRQEEEIRTVQQPSRIAPQTLPNDGQL